MPPILILNGASSAGKSALAKALQRRLETPLLDAGLDRFLFMLPGRYLNRPLWDDVLGRNAEAGATGHALVLAMHRAILALHAAGWGVAADHVLVEPAWVDDLAALLAPLPAYLIGVRCPLEVLVAREAGRGDRTLGQAAAQHPLVHAHDEYDFEVDTAAHSAEECAAQIAAYLEGGPAPGALRRLVQRRPPQQ